MKKNYPYRRVLLLDFVQQKKSYIYLYKHVCAMSNIYANVNKPQEMFDQTDGLKSITKQMA